MEILWLVVGVLMGTLIAWCFYVTAVRSEVNIQLAELVGQHEEARASRDSEREANQSQVLGLEGRILEQQSEIARLQEELSSDLPVPVGTVAKSASSKASRKLPGQAARKASQLPDDLTRIKGIGRVLEGKLHKLGITTFRQIADFTQSEIERVNAVVDIPGRIDRDQWVEQASAIVGWKVPKGLGRHPPKARAEKRPKPSRKTTPSGSGTDTTG